MEHCYSKVLVILSQHTWYVGAEREFAGGDGEFGAVVFQRILEPRRSCWELLQSGIPAHVGAR